MKKLIFILMVGSLLAQESPCEDETYLELKKKKLDEMSDREYQYFLNKDTQCNNYISSQNTSKISTDSGEINSLKTRKMIDLVGLTGIYGLTVSVATLVGDI